jgi:hypothetical protein
MLMMRFRRLRVFSALTAAASLLVPADAQAFLGLCQKRQNAAAALYGGTVCNPCGQQLVCNYVPQTCYRTQTVQVPVTTMRPVCGTDPCTGCRTTVMRPVVAYQQQVQYVPYSSYRLQYSVAQPACPTATTSYYAAVPSSGVGGAAPTYAAPAYTTPAATFAAPTLGSGCSSCNSGVAATSYYAPAAVAPPASYPVTTNYAPVPTTRMLTPGVVVPGAAAVAVPAPTNVYSYQSTPGSNANVNVGGYNYASPSASGITPPATYGSSSFTPAYTAPASAAPGYATPAPSYSSPSYSTPSYPTPAPSLGSGTITGGATLSAPSLSSSATAGSSYYPPSSGTILSSPSISGSVSSNAMAAGPLVPVPPSTTVYSNSGTPTPAPSLSTPSLSIPSAMSPLVLPAPPTQMPYSSGIDPNKLPMQPIPDPEINRRTSTPILIDPEDKTAMNFPIRRSVGYRAIYHVNGETKSVEVGVIPASHITEISEPAAAPSTAWEQPASQSAPTNSQSVPTESSSALAVSSFGQQAFAQPAAAVTGTAHLAAPRPAMEVHTVYTPQQPVPHQSASQTPSQATTDRDGWSAASR